MGIAVTKASLVVLFFMHVKYSPRLYWLWWGPPCSGSATCSWARCLDYLARLYVNLGRTPRNVAR